MRVARLITISSGRHDSAAMMASTSPSENHEAPPSSVWSTKGSTAIEGRPRWKLSTIGAGADSGPDPGPDPAPVAASERRPARRRRRAPAG